MPQRADQQMLKQHRNSMNVVPSTKQRPLSDISGDYAHAAKQYSKDGVTCKQTCGKHSVQQICSTSKRASSKSLLTDSSRLDLELQQELRSAHHGHYTDSAQTVLRQYSRSCSSLDQAAQTEVDTFSRSQSTDFSAYHPGYDLCAHSDSMTPLLCAGDLSVPEQQGLSNPVANRDFEQIELDHIVPIKRNRTSSQFSDDFVTYLQPKCSSAESSPSSVSRRCQVSVNRISFDQCRPASLDSLLSGFGAVRTFHNRQEGSYWENCPTTSRQASVAANDLFLEDIEDRLDYLPQMASWSESSLHDCSNHQTSDFSRLLLHVNAESVRVKNTFVNQCFEPCGTPGPHNVESQPSAGGATSRSNQCSSATSQCTEHAEVPAGHQPFECWLPPRYDDAIQDKEKQKTKPSSACQCLPAASYSSHVNNASPDHRDKATSGLSVALPQQTKSKHAVDAGKCSSAQRHQQLQQLPPEVWSITSDLKVCFWLNILPSPPGCLFTCGNLFCMWTMCLQSTHYPFHVYIFGGREGTSHNLGLQILPLSGWRLVIE